MPPKVTAALTVVTESTRTFSEALSALDCCICLDALADDAAEAEALRAATAPPSPPLQQQHQQQPLTSSSSLVEASLFAQQQQSAAAASSGGDKARAVCALPCGHLFHVGCVSEHLEARKNYSRDAECPLCRAPIPRWTPEELKARADLRDRLICNSFNGGGLGSSRKGWLFYSQQAKAAAMNALHDYDFIPDPPAANFMEEAKAMLEALAARGRQAAARGRRGRGGRPPQPPAIVSEEAVLALAASIAAGRGAAARQDAHSRKVAASAHEGTFKMYILNMNRRLAVEPLKPPPTADGSSSPTADGEEGGDGYNAESRSPIGSPRAEEFGAAAAAQSSSTHVRKTLLQFTPTAAASAPPTTAAAATASTPSVPAITNAPNLHSSNFVVAAAPDARNDEGSVGDVIFLTPAEAKQQLHSKHHEALSYLSRKTRSARERHDAEKNLAGRVVGLTAALHNLEASTAALAADSRIAEGLAELNARRFSIEQHRLRDGSFFRPCEVAAVYYKKAAAAVTERAALQSAYEAALLEQEELDAALADAEAEAARAQAAETQSDDDDGGDGSTTEDEDNREASNGLKQRVVAVGAIGSSVVGLSARERLSRDLRMRSGGGTAKAVAASTKRARSPLSELLFQQQQQRSRGSGNEGETATVQPNARRGDAVCVDSTTATRRPTTAAPWRPSAAIDLEATDDSDVSNSNTCNGNQAAPASTSTAVAVEYPPFMRATSDEEKANGYGYAASEQQLCWATPTPATAVATQPSNEAAAAATDEESARLAPMRGGESFTAGAPVVGATEASAQRSATACADGGPSAPPPPIFSAPFPSFSSSPSSSPNGGLASPPATQADGGWRQR